MLPPLSRLGRALGTLVIAACLALLATFAYDHLVHPTPRSAPFALRLLLALGLVAGPACLLLARFRVTRLRLVPWLALAASLTLFFTWLAKDESRLAHETDHPQLRSDFTEAAATHALVLRYSKNVPGSLHDSVPPTELRFPALSAEPPVRDAWLAYLETHRDAIHARWEEIAPLRAWFDELAAAPALADLTTAPSDPIPAFGPLRAVSQTASAQAALLALDGRRDEAVALLLPVFSAGQKLEVHARTLLRRMVAIVIQGQALATLTFVLDQGDIDSATRARLAEALRPHQDPAEGARLLLLSEYALSSRLIQSLSRASLATTLDYAQADAASGPSHPGARFFFNPVATANQLGDLMHAGAEAAARRDHEEMRRIGAEAEALASSTRRASKNIGGRLLIAMVMPAFSKVTERYWQVHDERLALLARL